MDREDIGMTLAVAFPVPAGEEIPQSFVVRVQGEHPACVAEATSATEAASAVPQHEHQHAQVPKGFIQEGGMHLDIGHPILHNLIVHKLLGYHGGYSFLFHANIIQQQCV